MQRESSSPNTLSFRETLGIWAYVLVPVLVGLITLAFGPLLGVLPALARDSWELLGILLVFVAVAFFQYRAMFHELVGCWGLTLDRARGVAITRYGLFWPRERETIPLAGVSHLSLRRVERRRGRRIDVWYEVAAPGTMLARAREYGRARAVAEEAGAFLKLPVHDFTSGEERVLAVDALGQGLRAQLGSEPIGEIPAGSLTTVERVGDDLVITPPDERTGCVKVWLLVFAIGAGLAAYRCSQGRNGRIEATVWGGIAGVFMAIGAAIVPYRERITAGPRGLLVEQTGWSYTGRYRYSAAELTDITPGENDLQVVAGLTTHSIALGRGKEERAWMARALKFALVGGPK